jgi:hypothetical protein
MNDLRKKIMKQLDELIGAEQSGLSTVDYDECYDDIVDNLEALVIEYSVDVTSDTLSDMPACSEENVAGYEVQDVDDEAKPAKAGKQIYMDFSKEKESHIAP